MLSFQQVSKKYAKAKDFAIKDINLTVEQGHIAGLLGESGSGKTTLLRLAAGFEAVDAGSIQINHKEVSSNKRFIPTEKRGIGMVFQDYALFPHMTVAKNLAYGLKKHQPKSDVGKILQLVGLQGLDKRYPHQLSGGQQQRVALARALVPQPDILLLDEPFSNLDENLKHEVRIELRTILKKAGITTVFVTHDAKDIFAIADQVAILSRGQLRQYGTPEDLYKRPTNTFVAKYFEKTNLIDFQQKNGQYETSIGNFSLKNLLPKKETGIMVIRPYHINISREGILHGRVETVHFLGSYRELTVSIQGQKILLWTPPDTPVEPQQDIQMQIKWQQVAII